MSNLDRVAKLTAEVEEARRAYVSTLASLKTSLPPGTNPVKLIEAAEEFGADHAIVLFEENPARYGIAPMSAPALNVAAAMLAAHMRATEALDLAFSAREDLLCLMDPKRLRRYCLDNRECEIDPKANTLRFLDQPDRIYRLELASAQTEPTPPAPRKRRTMRM